MELLQGDLPQSGGAAIRREQRLERLTRVDRDDSRRVAAGGEAARPANAVRRRAPARPWAEAWQRRPGPNGARGREILAAGVPDDVDRNEADLRAA
jgi:hypothetical protein